MRYLYYKLWQHFKTIKTNDMPATNAMLFISICQFANIFVIQILFEHFFFILIDLSSKAKIYYYTIPLSLSVMYINYLYLYKNRDKLYEKYKNESKRQKIIGYILLLIYVLGSFVLAFYLGAKYSTSITTQ